MTHAMISHYEVFFRAVRMASHRAKALVFGFVVVDMRGIAPFQMLRHMSLTRFAAEAGPTNWPEGTQRVLVVNAPRLVAALWNAIAPLLPAATQDKVAILSEAATSSALCEIISPAELPAFLGGERPDEETPVPLATPVPEGAVEA